MSRRDDDEPGRYPMGNRYGRPRHEYSDNENTEAPVDLAAVQADDALLDLLGSGEVAPDSTDAELARVLVAWRREVDAEPIGELVDTEQAVAAISAARKPRSRRHPVLGPMAVAAAMLVIAFSGIGLAAKSAQPGDQLFTLTKVLYADYARSAEAAKKVETELAEAQNALNRGETAKAEESLQQVQQQLPVIAEPEGRTRLAVEHDKLEERLAGIRSPDEPGASPEQPPSPPSPPASPSEAALPPAPLPDSATPTSTVEGPTASSSSATSVSTTPSTPTVPGESAPEISTATPRVADPESPASSTPPVPSSGN